MPTQRPFFANFFSAFRARSSPTFQAKSSTTTGAISPSLLSASAHVSTTATTVTSASSPRNITTKTGPDGYSQSSNLTAGTQPVKTTSTSPFGAAALTSGSPGTTFYRRPPSPGPHGHNLALSPPGHATPMSRGRQRRDSGSSNSSGGFMDAMGPDKWYVGGRTATGEERFYQLALVSGNDGKRLRTISGCVRTKHHVPIGWQQSPHRLYDLDLVRVLRPIRSLHSHRRTRLSSRCPYLPQVRFGRTAETVAFTQGYSRRQSTAHAIKSPQDHEEDGNSQEPPHSTPEHWGPLTIADVKEIPADLCFTVIDLISFQSFPKRIQGFRKRGHRCACFEDSTVFRAVLPKLAMLMGLEHITPQTAQEDIKSALGTFHILAKPAGPSDAPKGLNISIGDYLRKEIFAHHFEDLIQDLRVGARVGRIGHHQLWKFLQLVCKGRPLAMPMPELIEGSDSLAHANKDAEYQSSPCQFRLSNQHYNIVVTKSVEDAANQPDESVVDALLTYCQEIWKVVEEYKHDVFTFDRDMWDPAEFLSRGLSDLSWGDIKILEAPVTSLGLQSYSSPLWRVTIQTAKRGQIGPAIIWSNRKFARLLGFMHASASLKDHLRSAYERDLFPASEYQVFARYWDEVVIPPEKNEQLGHLGLTPTRNILIDDEIISTMFAALRNLVQSGFQSTYQWSSSNAINPRLYRDNANLLRRDISLDRQYLQRQLARPKKPLVDMDLPVLDHTMSNNIKEAVENSDITIITASTGSGKTTQIPQLIFDQHVAALLGSTCSIVCTQPRRVSTISVATRVAAERHQRLGQDVGYMVRFDNCPPASNSGITYMTSGYLLRMLEKDPQYLLQNYSHIILDEVHTRDIDTDMLLTGIKHMFAKSALPGAAKMQKMPKIILMSATIDAEFFRNYFQDAWSQITVTSLEVPGKMFPVEVKNLDSVMDELRASCPTQLAALMQDTGLGKYANRQFHLKDATQDEFTSDAALPELGQASELPDKSSTAEDFYIPLGLLHLAIVHLADTTLSGDILVFLPGLSEIETLERLLETSPSSTHDFADSGRFRIFKLHSALYETNYDAFKDVPRGCRRVVLATNIAETSITLPDVRFVLDSGLARESTFDQISQSGTFGLRWISKAEVKQRKGRAGRTNPGIYYGVYSQAQYEAMAEAPTPEMLKMALEQLVLRSSASSTFSVNPADDVDQVDLLAGHALLNAPSPPPSLNVQAAAQQVRHINALTVDGDVTAMGEILSRLPMTPSAAKAVLLGGIFRCLDPILLSGATRDDFPLMFDGQRSGTIADLRKILSGLADDDRWADTRAFRLYDTQRRSRNREATTKIKEVLSIRHDAYCDQAQTSKQTFEILRPLFGLDEDLNIDQSEWLMLKPLFPSTPKFLNTNSKNADLVKAITLGTSGTRLAVWSHKNWCAERHARVLPTPRSVNHHSRTRAISAQRFRREPGDLLSYGNMRTVSKDKYPWLHQTSIVTPLIGILFAESVALDEDNSTFIINDWIRYKVKLGTANSDVKRAVKLIWEYRKALDRFLALAMQTVSLAPHKLTSVKEGKLKTTDFNVFFKEPDHPFRKIIVNSVVQILEVDAKVRAERLRLRMSEMNDSSIDEVLDTMKQDASDQIPGLEGLSDSTYDDELTPWVAPRKPSAAATRSGRTRSLWEV